jgi:hypothetical protein
VKVRSGSPQTIIRVLVAFLALGLPSAAHAAIGLLTGFNPAGPLTDPPQSSWIGNAVADGAGIVRVNVLWSSVAPAQPPAGFVASDPATPGYSWLSTDAAVRALADRGLGVLLNISSAPTWAEGPGQPPDVTPNTWRPDPQQFAQFAEAAARRYDGSFADPVHPGAVLPRVRYWQAWNEPNLDVYLTPQWTFTSHGFAPASPTIYRGLLNAFYDAVKGVSASNVVVSAGMAPYGNPPGFDQPAGYRMQPVTFDRALFSAPAHLDVLAQNTYPIQGPTWHAVDADDVAVADLYKVERVLRDAQRAGTALPRTRKQVWVTELGWDSKPPNPDGVPIAEQARWYEQALYMLWRQGVDAVLLLQLIDSPSTPADVYTAYEEGLYYADGSPKPAATAFRFPFVANPLGGGRVQLWGRAPVGGELLVERKRGGRWRVIAGFRVGWHKVFLKTISLPPSTLRAQIEGQTSLPWTR